MGALFEDQEEANGAGINEFDIKLYFRKNYRGMASSWCEQVMSAVHDAVEVGWLLYDSDSALYTLDDDMANALEDNPQKSIQKLNAVISKKYTSPRSDDDASDQNVQIPNSLRRSS